MKTFKVTTLENFDNQTKTLKNKDFIGTCVKTESIQRQNINENQQIETSLITVCTIIWDNFSDFYPACSVYAAEQLVFLGADQDRQAILEQRLGYLASKIEDLEDAVYLDDDEDDDEDESEVEYDDGTSQ